MADSDLYRIKLSARNIEELRAFLDSSGVDFGCRPVVRREADALVVEVYATMPQIDAVRASKSGSAVQVTVEENATANGIARQAEVGIGNRFAATRAISGLGVKE